MRASTGTLTTWLPTATARFRADLYTITLNGGGVLRYTDADVELTVGGNTFLKGPKIEGGNFKSSRGLQVDQIDITFAADETDLVSGTPFLTFIQTGLDGAEILIERAIYSSRSLTDLIGTYIRFSGRFTGVKDLGGSSAVVVVSSWLELLNISMPPDVYQSPCRFLLYQGGCPVVRADFMVTSSIDATSTAQVLQTPLTQAAGYFDLGVITFTSGANAGLSHTIKEQAGDGTLTLVLALPVAPGIGDDFEIVPGCDRTLATCVDPTKFNNDRTAFGGEPFIPVPVSVI